MVAAAAVFGPSALATLFAGRGGGRAGSVKTSKEEEETRQIRSLPARSTAQDSQAVKPQSKDEEETAEHGQVQEAGGVEDRDEGEGEMGREGQGEGAGSD